jgi:hypothetical protein
MNVDAFINKLAEDSDMRNTIAVVGSTVARFKQDVATIKSDGRYSAAGHAERAKQAAEAPLKLFSELRKQFATERASLARRQDHFQLTPPDRRDIFGEMRAREMRDFLRGLPLSERIRHVLADPEMAAAAIHAPPALTGIDGDVRERIIHHELERKFGDELAILRREREELEVAGSALDVTEAQLRVEAGLSNAKPEPVAA